MKKASEHNIQSSILDYLARRGVFHFRNNSGALPMQRNGQQYFVRFGAKGSPDIICVIAGRFVGLEVKDEKGKQSEDQKEFQRSLESAGGIYFLVRSIDEAMEAVEDCISRLRIADLPVYRNRKDVS